MKSLLERHLIRIAGQREVPGRPMLYGTTRRFLERVWRKTEYIQHEWWENAAVLDLLGYRVRTPVRPARPSPWRLGVSFLDTAWNSIPDDPAAAPRIVHLPGLPLETRRARMRELADTTLSTVAAGGDEWTKPPRP